MTATAVVFVWLCVAAITSAQQVRQQWASEEDLAKLEVQVATERAKLEEHILADYKRFAELTAADLTKINDLNTRLALVESSQTNTNRILLGILGALGLQLGHLFFGLFKIEIVRRRKPEEPEQQQS